MGAHSKPGLEDPFDEAIEEALRSFPKDLSAAVRNVAILVEDEAPDGQMLGLFSGVPRQYRVWNIGAVGMLPAKVTIFRGPITRLAAGDAERLRSEVRRVLLHELRQFFGVE